jgi:FkbM family methyltransferase
MTRSIPAPVRWATERLLRNIVFRSHLPARFGGRSIYLSPGNHLAVLKPGENRFEEYLLGFVERFVGDGSVVWDIGANMGMFAFPAAHKAGPRGFVLAIEPDPFNQLILQRTRRHSDNADLNVTILPAAVSHEVGTAELQIPQRGRSANSLTGGVQGTQTGGVRERLTVMTVTLDWIAEHYPPPQFIKCDAEGAETWILQGASKMLKTVRPIINIEMPKENAQICKAILASNNYATFSAYLPIAPDNELAAIDSVWEVLAVPREQLGGLVGR